MVQSSKSRIQFHYLTRNFQFPERNRLKDFIRSLFKKEAKVLGELSYIFCTDEYLLEMNRQFLNHDTYTDIITFPLSGKGEPISSEIYISIDRVKQNAEEYQVSTYHELLRVVFHGALHLCGYKDKSTKDIKLMREKEDYYLSLFLVPRGT
jgi:probable rRNA maturation factor